MEEHLNAKTHSGWVPTIKRVRMSGSLSFCPWYQTISLKANILNFLLTFENVGAFCSFNWVRIWRLLFLAHISPNYYILITELSWMLWKGLFRGLVYREFFFRNRFLSKNMSCPCLILSYFFASTEKRKSHECCAICDFFVNSRKDGYILAVLVGYQVRASFFKSASTLDTLTVANCLPQLADR